MTKASEKKAFAWDKETELKTIEVSEYERRVVAITELNDKQYVSVATHKKVKGEWKPVKNATFPLEVWGAIVDAIADHNLAVAFGSTTDLTAPPKAGKPQKEIVEDVPSKDGSLSAVQVLLKLEQNENFLSLGTGKQEKLINQVVVLHKEHGMVTVGITKTSSYAEYGMSHEQAEAAIKKKKGFSRASFVRFP